MPWSASTAEPSAHIAGKVCGRCKTILPYAAFGKETKNKDGLNRWCKKCGNATRREKYNADHEYRKRKQEERRRAYSKNPKLWDFRARDNFLKYHYGIDIKEFDAIFLAQGNSCGLCAATTNNHKRGTFHVDHCHKTNRVRGVLCHTCNTSLGVFEKFRDRVGLEKISTWLKE